MTNRRCESDSFLSSRGSQNDVGNYYLRSPSAIHSRELNEIVFLSWIKVIFHAVLSLFIVSFAPCSFAALYALSFLRGFNCSSFSFLFRRSGWSGLRGFRNNYFEVKYGCFCNVRFNIADCENEYFCIDIVINPETIVIASVVHAPLMKNLPGHSAEL